MKVMREREGGRKRHKKEEEELGNRNLACKCMLNTRSMQVCHTDERMRAILLNIMLQLQPVRTGFIVSGNKERRFALCPNV